MPEVCFGRKTEQTPVIRMENEEMLFAEEDRKTVAFIKNYLPQEVKDKFSEDDIYYFLDAFVEYCDKKGMFESEEEECDVDLDEAAAFMAQLAKKEKIGSFEADDVRWIVDGQMEYWDSLNEE
jgi:hypothetical protein